MLVSLALGSFEHLPAALVESSCHRQTSPLNFVVLLEVVSEMTDKMHVCYHALISCKLTSGCLSQVPRSLVPCAVLHLFSSPNSVVFRVVEPTFPGASIRLSALSALASSRMYWPSSCVRIEYALWLEGSDRRDR